MHRSAFNSCKGLVALKPLTLNYFYAPSFQLGSKLLYLYLSASLFLGLCQLLPKQLTLLLTKACNPKGCLAGVSLVW